MKYNWTLATATLLISAGSAFAGNLDVPDVAPLDIAAPAANDWAGLYAGGLVSFDSGEAWAEFSGVPGPVYAMNDTTAYGGFAGYNIQRGAFVFGGEIAVSTGGINAVAIPGSAYETIFDLKARAGYSFGKVLAYGVIGGSFANFDDNGTDQFPSAGLVYGAGVDVMIGAHMFVGAEYLIRDLSGAGENVPTTDIVGNIQSAQLRIGWNF